MGIRSKLTIAVREREHAIMQLRNQGVQYKDIAKQYNISETRAYQIWASGMSRLNEPGIALERKRALEIRDTAERRLWAKEQNPPPARVIQHADGRTETIYDLDYPLKVMAEIRKWEEHNARILGLYSQVEVKVQQNNFQPRSYDDVVSALRTVLEEDHAIQSPIETDATDVTDPQSADIQQIEHVLLNGDTPAE